MLRPSRRLLEVVKTGGTKLQKTYRDVQRARRTLAAVEARCVDVEASGLYPDACAATEDNFGEIADACEARSGVMLLDCWSRSHAHECIGQTAALMLAQRWANARSEVQQAIGGGGVERFTLDVDANDGLAAHLGVQQTPTVLLVGGGDEIYGMHGNASSELMADFCVENLLRTHTDVYGSLESGRQGRQADQALVEAWRDLENGCHSDALYKFKKVLRRNLALLQRAEQEASKAGAAAPPPPPSQGLSLIEAVSAKAAAGVAQGLLLADEVAEGKHALSLVEECLPRAVGTLSDVRRSVAATSVLMLQRSEGAVPEDVRDACLVFLRGEYDAAFAALLADGGGGDGDGALFERLRMAPHAQIAVLRFLAYLTPHHPAAAAALAAHPGLRDALGGAPDGLPVDEAHPVVGAYGGDFVPPPLADLLDL